MLAERRIKRAIAPVTSPRTKRRLIAGRDELAGGLARIRATRRGSGAPDFIIIGAQKAGTTFLYQELCRHEQVLPALTKEIHFFDDRYRRWKRAYPGFFPATGPGQITGEASPGYVFHPHAIERIAADLPDVRLLMTVRDPVRRAFSQFQHETRLGFEDAPDFATALDREPERLAGEHERMEADPSYVSFSWRHHSYVARGHYLDQIRAVEALVGPDRLLVLPSEALYSDTTATLRRAFECLGIDDSAPTEIGGNDMREPTGSRIDARDADRLREHFREPNRALADHLGLDLGWDDG